MRRFVLAMLVAASVVAVWVILRDVRCYWTRWNKLEIEALVPYRETWTVYFSHGTGLHFWHASEKNNNRVKDGAPKPTEEDCDP